MRASTFRVVSRNILPCRNNIIITPNIAARHARDGRRKRNYNLFVLRRAQISFAFAGRMRAVVVGVVVVVAVAIAVACVAVLFACLSLIVIKTGLSSSTAGAFLWSMWSGRRSGWPIIPWTRRVMALRQPHDNVDVINSDFVLVWPHPFLQANKDKKFMYIENYHRNKIPHSHRKSRGVIATCGAFIIDTSLCRLRIRHPFPDIHVDNFLTHRKHITIAYIIIISVVAVVAVVAAVS